MGDLLALSDRIIDSGVAERESAAISEAGTR